MVKFSDLYPLSTGAGASTIAGLTSQGVKQTDFIAVANSFYEIIGSCLITLPSSPAINDKVGFVLTSTANVDITSNENLNGSLLATDYVKRVTQLYTIIVLTYSGSSNGWVWDSRDNGYISNQYTGTGANLLYTSSSVLDGLFDYLGTNGNTETWSSPYPSKASITLTSGSAFTNPQNFVDKDINTYLGTGFGDNRANTFRVNLLNNVLIQPNKLLVRVSETEGYSPTITVLGVKSDNGLESIGSVSIPWNSPQNYLFTITSDSTFKAFQFTSTAGNNQYFNLEIWGTLTL